MTSINKIELSFPHDGKERTFSLSRPVDKIHFIDNKFVSELSLEISPNDVIFFCLPEPAGGGYLWNFDHFPDRKVSDRKTVSQIEGVTILSDQHTLEGTKREVLLSVDPVLCSEIEFICRRPFNGEECNRIILRISEYNSVFERLGCIHFKFEDVSDYISKIREKFEFKELVERLRKYPCQVDLCLDLIGDKNTSSYAQSTCLLALIEIGHKDFLSLNVELLPYWTKKVLNKNCRGYALWFISDQTHVYLTPEHSSTCVCKEAMIFDTYSEAKGFSLSYPDYQPLEIEAILDLEEFKSREDTW